MCGIAGSVNFLFDPNIVNRVMGHRGPDERAYFQQENVLLHHLRLAIVDLSGGKQPMHYLNRYTIIFNGEFYNHQDVREQLKLNCTTGSDTETFLHAWHKIGPKCLQLFDGMFALALFDNQEKELFLIRDRAGKKPLYYYDNGQQLVFASELNALKAVLPLEIDEENIGMYFRLGACFREQTPYKQVQELGNGHYIKISTNTLKSETIKWWDISDFYQTRNPIEEKEALEKVEGMLAEGVRRRIISSDLEVGAFLSGGIDSGLIVAMASQYSNKIKTFTVSFRGQFDESALAVKVAAKFGTTHRVIEIGFEGLKNDLEKILSNYGEPFFDSSAIPSYYVSNAAKEHLTVILNGDGADELFGGYRRFVPFAHFNFLNAPKPLRQTAKGLAALLPPGHQKKSAYNYFYRLLSFAGKENNTLFLAAGPDIFEGFENFLEPAYQTKGMHELKNYLNALPHSGLTALQQMMNADFQINLFCDLLVKMDIATMSHSLEGRSPMLCKELLEFVPGLPDKLKIRGGTTKYLLRQLAAKHLPPEISVQPKRGFEIPLKDWVNNDLHEIITDYLQASNPFYKKFVQNSFVTNLLNRKIRISEEKRAKILWSLFCLEVWHKKVYLNS